MDSTRDLLVARIAMERGLVTRAVIEECLHLQGQVTRLGLPVPLAWVLERKGLLTAEQAAEVDRAAREQAHSGTQIGTIADTDRATMPTPGPPGTDLPAPAVPAASAAPARSGATDGAPVRSAVSEPGPSIGGRRKLGGYAIVRELGRGAMGVVYEAWQENPHRPVALKVVGGESLGPKAIGRFRREAEAVGRLSHPNIVRIYEAGEEDGIPFLAMELIDGCSLEREAAGGRMPVERAVRLFAQAADAIHHAHGHGIIHRDLKPANLMIAAGDRVILTDFGLARDLAAATLTASGAIMGTPMYMPPEQAEGRVDELDARSDVYALGASLYEVLTGQPLFTGDTVATVIQKVLVEEPRSLRAFRPEIARELEWVVMKALRKEKERRYQTAEELSEDLRRWLDGGMVQARPTSVAHRAVRVVRRNRVAALALGLAALSLAVGTAVYWRRMALRDIREAALRDAESQVRSGNLERGLELLETLVAEDPGFAHGHVERGRLLARLGRRADARDAFRTASDAEPRSAEAWTELGVAEQRLGRTESAFEALERAVALQESYALARVERGAAHARAGRATEAAADFEAVRASAAPAPLRARAECGMGDLALERGDVGEARLRFDAAQVLAPEDPAPFEGRGRCLLEARDFAGADAEFARAAERAPKEVRYVASRARTALRQGDPERALPLLDAAMRLSPADAEVRFLWAVAGPAEEFDGRLDASLGADAAHRGARIARALRRMEAKDEAGTSADLEALNGEDAAWLGARAAWRFGRAAGDPPVARPEVLLLRARVAAGAGNLAGAYADLAAVARCAPATGLGFELWADACSLWDGIQRLDRLRDDQRARRDLRRVSALCERVTRLLPDHGAAHWLRARALFELARWRQALDVAGTAIEVQPALVEARGWRAFFHVVLEEFTSYSSAQSDLDVAQTLEPERARWHVFAGVLRLMRRDLPGARLAAARALEIDPKCAAALRLMIDVQTQQGNDPGERTSQEWRALPGDPAASRFLEYAAASARDRQDVKTAVFLYEQAIREDPRNAQALLDLGQLLEVVGRDPVRPLYLQFQAGELHPDFALRGYFGMLPMLRRASQSGELSPLAMRVVLTQIPAGSIREVIAGFMMYARGKNESAVKYFDAALKADPQSMLARCFKGAALALLSRFEPARQCIEEALEMRPNSGCPIYFQACVEAQAGNGPRAMELLSRCLEFGIPGFQEGVREEPFFQHLRDTDEFEKLFAQ